MGELSSKFMILGQISEKLPTGKKPILVGGSACKHWKSQYDCEQAKVLFEVYSEKIDLEYLKKRMKEEDLEMELIEK